MGKTVKKIIFALFCFAFTMLIVYVVLSHGKVSRETHEYEKTLEKLAEAPEIRSGVLYFNMLDTRCQYVYDVLKQTIKEGKEFTPQIPFVLTEEELHRSAEALCSDDPSLYYINVDAFDLQNHSYTEKKGKTGYLVVVPSIVDDRYTKIHIPYTVKNDGSSAFFDKTQSRFSAALKKADVIVSDVHDKYLVCRLIHDYLTGICSKTEEGGVYANTAYGALVEGEATSLGYAKAFKLLYERYSGTSYIIRGGGGYWCSALLNDKYYNVDVYSDDLDGMINGEEHRGAQSHLYLCLDDESFYKDHPEKLSGPTCSDKTNYFIYNGTAPSTPSELSNAVLRLVEEQRFAKGRYFEIYCEIEGAEELIREAVVKTLSENYPDFANDCEIFRLSENQPVYLVHLTDKNESSGGN
ncbi:MAG: hypothetical protein II135_06045 [Clostridia bacterium]|nr:hypothetical protein [Clostridia bacterium]